MGQADFGEDKSPQPEAEEETKIEITLSEEEVQTAKDIFHASVKSQIDWIAKKCYPEKLYQSFQKLEEIFRAGKNLNIWDGIIPSEFGVESSISEAVKPLITFRTAIANELSCAIMDVEKLIRTKLYEWLEAQGIDTSIFNPPEPEEEFSRAPI